MPDLTQLLVVLVKAGVFSLHDRHDTGLDQLKQEFKKTAFCPTGRTCWGEATKHASSQQWQVTRPPTGRHCSDKGQPEVSNSEVQLPG